VHDELLHVVNKRVEEDVEVRDCSYDRTPQDGLVSLAFSQDSLADRTAEGELRE
jgi:hypothetical protein